MSAFASILSPMSYSAAIELGNHRWQKKILPVGDLEYQGRQLHFTPAYIKGLADAFHNRAYDQVSFQLADAQNTHTNDPERHRGTIVDMKAQADGLYVILEPTERGERILAENPYLGVSARIVEQYQRGDGAFFPAAVQHVLGTLDPRIPGLGAWQPVDMANSGAITIDLSSYSFAGEPAPVADPFGGLTDAELGDLISAISEADAEGYADPDAELSDAELNQLIAAAERDERDQRDSFSEFDQAFAARAQAEADREAARQEFEQMDLLRPAIRSEDRMQRILAKAAAGLYDGQEQMSFSSEQAAVEITLANGGHGPCGVTDSYDRCAERYHALGCAHDVTTDWMATEGGPPRAAYDQAFSNFADHMAIDLSRRQVWDDYDNEDQAPVYMPQATIELAHSLSVEWGLDSAAPGGIADTSPGWQDLLRPPGAPVSVQEELLAGMGVELPAEPRPAYPGVSEIRARLGI